MLKYCLLKYCNLVSVHFIFFLLQWTSTSSPRLILGFRVFVFLFVCLLLLLLLLLLVVLVVVVVVVVFCFVCLFVCFLEFPTPQGTAM